MVKLRGNAVMAVTPNIASQLKLFGVQGDKMKIILQNENFEKFESIDDALTKEIEIEIITSSKTFPMPAFSEKSANDANRCMRSLRVLSLFSGCGGLDRGLAGADGKGGFKTKWAIDACANSLDTLKAHMPSTTTFALDVGEVLEQMHTLPGMPRKGEVDVILMGTPCEPFSFLVR
jgi:C-5 cytosine-specific DNA methylase